VTLEGKKVVVLGGTSGIGFAVAQAAQAEKANVVVVSSSVAKVSRAKANLRIGAESLVLDLTNEGAVRSFFGNLGAFDHLVYTAGDSLVLDELIVLDLSKARKLFDVRYWGAVAAVKYGHSHICPGGSIVLSSGLAGRKPKKGWTAAASICGAMESLTRSLAVELAPLRVNLVCPGLVKTELWDVMPPADRQEKFDQTATMLPARHVGEPFELAEAYLYLMKAGFTTGSVVIADGGQSLI
jgi:NAD(P)-dependent dehydrogenase (short-subunit alcohol dehydrogenase family)